MFVVMEMYFIVFVFFFFMQNTAYEVRISDWSSDVCSSDLPRRHVFAARRGRDADRHLRQSRQPTLRPAGRDRARQRLDARPRRCGRRLSRSRHDRTPSLTKQQQIDLGRARGLPKIRHVRAFTVRGGGADYHDQPGGHWIEDHIATPMARSEEYRASRQSFGINVLGTLVVEIEAERKGTRLNSSHSCA